MKLLITLCAVSFIAACAFGADTTLDLIIVAGQSNAVGFDADPAQLPADAADKSIMFWWRCGDPPPDDHDTMSNGWTTLQPQSLGKPADKKSAPRQYGNFSHAAGGFGPEIALARTLAATEHHSPAVLKAAFSGTGVRMDWNPTSKDADGACYRALVDETHKAIDAAKAKGITFRIRALAWVQGESDANANDAPQYEKRLGEMIEALRTEFAAPAMIALIGVNTNFGLGKNAFMPKIVEAQKALCSHLPHSVYVDTANSTYANSAHFDTAGILDVGRRYAEALIKLEGLAK
jgi:hypothetical protein